MNEREDKILDVFHEFPGDHQKLRPPLISKNVKNKEEGVFPLILDPVRPYSKSAGYI